MKYILAADQGGTKTEILIADLHGHIVGYGDDRELIKQNASLWLPDKKERRAFRQKRIRYAAEAAASDAGLDLSDIESVSACCIGADWPYEYELGTRQLRETLGIDQVNLYNDCIGALRGGTETQGRDCAVVCLGTGTNCALLNREGQQLIYAYYLKDIHQGASAIGRFIFEAVFDAESGLGKETALTGLLLNATGYSSAEELFMAVTAGRNENELPWEPVYQDYSPLLFEAIKSGDKVSSEYLEWYCGGLAQYVINGAEKLKMRDREITLIISGGVPKSGTIISELIGSKVRERLPGVKCKNAVFEPVVGALLLEYDRIYPDGIPENIMRPLEQSCAKRNLFR